MIQLAFVNNAAFQCSLDFMCGTHTDIEKLFSTTFIIISTAAAVKLLNHTRHTGTPRLGILLNGNLAENALLGTLTLRRPRPKRALGLRTIVSTRPELLLTKNKPPLNQSLEMMARRLFGSIPFRVCKLKNGQRTVARGVFCLTWYMAP